MSTPFRLFSARVDESNAYAEKITFIASQQKGTNPDTFFSVIIGNNGTGKSRVLCSIAKLFREICEKNIIPGYSAQWQILPQYRIK